MPMSSDGESPDGGSASDGASDALTDASTDAPDTFDGTVLFVDDFEAAPADCGWSAFGPPPNATRLALPDGGHFCRLCRTSTTGQGLWRGVTGLGGSSTHYTVSGAVRAADGGGAPFVVWVYEGSATGGGTSRSLNGVMSDAGPAFTPFSADAGDSDAGGIIVWLEAADSRCVDFDNIMLQSP
jgi:hypothetical protein